MPNYVWIVITALIPVVVTVMLVMMWKRGFKGTGKGVTFVVQGSGKEVDSDVAMALTYTEKTVPGILDILYRQYLSLMEEAGADRDRLGSYEDSVFMKMLLRYAVCGGNGSNSTQKILESEVLDQRNRRESDDIAQYTRLVVFPRVMRSLKDYIDRDYQTDVMDPDGNTRSRRVSSTDYIVAMTTGETVVQIEQVIASDRKSVV